MFYRPTLLALAFVVLPVVCYAEVITAYDLTGKAGSEFFDSATAMAPHVNGEALLRGTGLTATAAPTLSPPAAGMIIPPTITSRSVSSSLPVIR